MIQQNSLSSEERKTLILSSIGGMLELYDFAIYGVFAIYFSRAFFPTGNEYLSTLETAMIFMLGFILRPLGGMLFSHIGDEYGRKKVLVITIFLMGLSSLGIACIPTHAQIGVIATILLIVMRLLQGLAVGGELPTTFVYISESMHNRRFFAFAITMAGIFSGYLLAALINYILTTCMTTDNLTDYGWRIPFLLGGVICFLSFKVRQTLRETSAFQSVLDKPKIPLVELLNNYKLKIATGIFLSATQHVFSVISIMYLPKFLSNVLGKNLISLNYLMPLALSASVITLFLLGYLLKNKTNYNKFIIISFMLNIIGVPITFYLMYLNFAIIGYILFMILHAIIALIIPLYITLLFPADIRLSGVAISYNLSIAILGGSAPLIITFLTKITDLIFIVPAAYLVLFFIIGLVCAMKTSDKLFNLN